MALKDNLIYGGIALASVILLIWIIPAHTPPYPGYGVSAALLPNLTAGFILAMAASALVKNILVFLLSKSQRSRQGPASGGFAEEAHLWHLSRFLIPCFLLMPAMTWIGFIPAGIAFLVLIQYLCGQRKPFTMAAVAVGLVLLVYGVMRYGFGAPMP